jgi:hypothetical protein
MAEKIIKIYDIVTKFAGLEGRMKLAVKTGVSRTQAAEIEDTPDKLAEFAKEASDIIGRDISELVEGAKN